jgi:EmrB/QacA subfamily drug resistance transporter
VSNTVLTVAVDTVPLQAPGDGRVSDRRDDTPDPRRWIALSSLMTGLFMVLLDLSIVTVAVPAIRASLQADNADIQFVVAGYALAYAVMLITGGRLGDIYGRKRLFVVGMTGFMIASAACGLAQSALMLDLSRVVQGLMASLMYPQVLTIIQVLFPARERARVFSLTGAVVGLATIAGPVVGGLIIRDDVVGSSWRWVFLVNVPIGLISLAGAFRAIRESRAPNAARLDVLGTLIATIGLGLLVYPLVEGQTAGWPVWTYICMGVSPLVLGIFIAYERSLPGERFPLVQLSMFGNRSFSAGTVISLVFFAGIPAFFFTFSLVLQVGLGFSALDAGLTTLPWSVGVAAASLVSARLAPRFGRWTVTSGSTILTVGVLGVILTLHRSGTGVTSWALTPALFVSGLGMGTVLAPLLNLVLSGIPTRYAGSASGIVNTVQQLGGAIGVAVVGVIFFGLLQSRATSAVALVTPQLRIQLEQAHLPAAAARRALGTFSRCFAVEAASSNPQQVAAGCTSTQSASPSVAADTAFTRAAKAAIGDDFVSSLERVLLLNAGFWILTVLISPLLPRGRLPGSSEPGGQ